MTMSRAQLKGSAANTISLKYRIPGRCDRIAAEECHANANNHSDRLKHSNYDQRLNECLTKDTEV